MYLSRIKLITMRLIVQILQALLDEMFDGQPYLHRPEIKKYVSYLNIPYDSCYFFGIKIYPKQNVLSGSKLLSRDSESHIFLCACFLWQLLVITNSILKQLIIPEYHMGVYHKWGSNANGRPAIFDVSHDL